MIEESFILKSLNKAVYISELDEEYKLSVSPVVGSIDNLCIVPINITHLQQETIIIDSTHSGTRNHNKDLYQQIIKQLFALLEIEHTYFVTKEKDSIKQFARSLVPGKEYTVIFLSGDTSVNEFVNGLQNNNDAANINISVIPCGTGNSFSLSLGITNKMTAIKRLLIGNKAPLNLYSAIFPTGSFYLSEDVKSEFTNPLSFLVVLSWGFHASIVADSDTTELRKFGIERFKMAAISNLKKEQKYDGDVIMNDTVIEGPFSYWLVTPATRFEPTFEILPYGDITVDGLYMVAIKSEYGEHLMDIMQEVYDHGKHIHDKRVLYEPISKGQKIKLKMGDYANKRICIDGSILGLPEPANEIIIETIGNHQYKWNLYVIQ